MSHTTTTDYYAGLAVKATRERDTARSIAVALEQENAELRGLVERALTSDWGDTGTEWAADADRILAPATEEVEPQRIHQPWWNRPSDMLGGTDDEAGE